MASKLTEQVRQPGAVLAAYDQQGWHRTGTTVDCHSARWLAKQADRGGGRSPLDAFAFERLGAGPGYIELDGRRVAGLALFDEPLTLPTGVCSPLVSSESNGGIALMRADPRGEVPPLDRARRGNHNAVVAVTESRHGGIAPLNAHESAYPFGLPVLQVAARHGAWLEKARQETRTSA